LIVVDASVWVSALIPEDTHHDASSQWLRRVERNEEEIAIPALALPEIAGAIARRTGNPELGKKAVSLVLRMPGLRIVPLDARAGEVAADSAARYRLRGADAVYLAAAHALRAPLATLDHELRERAGESIAVIEL